jgi:uncharacterized Zn ribbon protein
MKNFVLLFVVVCTFGLLSQESKAQGAVSFSAFSKERRALIHKPYRARLQGAFTLLKRNGMGKDSISISEALQEKEMAHRGLLKGITYAESKQILKKTNRAMMSNAQVYLIDTVISYGTSDTNRYSYSYNASGNQLTDLTEQWQNGQWTNSYRDTYIYDASGNQLTSLYEWWQNGQWTNSDRYTFTYDASGNELTELYEVWANGQWTNSDCYTYTYDASGNQLTSLSEWWQNGQWTNSYRDTYTYDASGNQLTSLYEWWQNGQWTNSDRSTYTYDASGNQLTELYEVWANGQWTNSYRSTNTYDAGRNQLTELAEQWQNGQWTNSDRSTNTYDAGGNQLTELAEQWQNGQWTNSDRSTNTYDASGNQLTSLYEWWQNGQWTNSYCYTYTYDANGNLVSFSNERWQVSAWVPSDGSMDVLYGHKDYVYIGYDVRITYKLTDVTGISASKPDVPTGFSLSQNYPNPFNPSTSISFNLPSRSFVSLKIFDLLGREVATMVSEEMLAGSYSKQWNAANLSSGIYFYRLQAGSFIETKKLVLLR